MLLTISVTVIAAIMVVALIFQIPILMQIRRTAREAEKFLETSRTQIVPLSHDLTVIFQEVKTVLQSIHRQVDRVEESVTTVRDAATRLREFEEEILGRVEGPLLELSALIRAVSQGVQPFSAYFVDRKSCCNFRTLSQTNLLICLLLFSNLTTGTRGDKNPRSSDDHP